MLTSIAMPIGIEFVWKMSGTFEPKNGYRQIAINPVVGGAVD